LSEKEFNLKQRDLYFGISLYRMRYMSSNSFI